MKKKQKIRELREQRTTATRQVHQQEEALRQEAIIKQKKAEEDAAKEKRIQELIKRHHPAGTCEIAAEKKSSAKAAGLKSNFVLDGNHLLMTSFGKGNEAIPEKKVASGQVSDLTDKPSFTATPEDDARFRIDGRVRNATADNPLHFSEELLQIHDDLIHARPVLERLYYGQNFEDNIHIQAIYSILDVEKALSLHINNIVYMLNNMLRSDGEDLMDLVGTLFTDVKFQKFINGSGDKGKEKADAFRRLCSSRQLGYLNLEVIPSESPKDENGMPIKREKDPNTVKIKEEEFYYMLLALSKMRHMLAHGDPEQNIYLIRGGGKEFLFTTVLDRLYRERVQSLNTGFLKKAQKNLVILFRAFSVQGIEQKASYVRDYYDFTVRKNYKNTGFSIKLLREHMTSEIEEAFVLRDKQYDTVRGKLYPFVDFAIFRYYKERPAEAEELVASLRAAMSEQEKEVIYSLEADRIWPQKQVRGLIIEHILPEMTGDNIKNISSDPEVNADMLRDVMVSSEATDFSKLIYMLTLFINGKEINDLLTSLIHQFENIAAFTSVLKSQGLPSSFTKRFELFDQSDRVAKELRVINSFARMEKPAAKAKKAMFVEAFRVLGMKGDEETLFREVREILDPEISYAGTWGRGIRNFIANNVIESIRFKYLVRYGNVKKLKTLARSRALVSFVLKDIPDDQIRRYCNRVGTEYLSDADAMRSALTDRLTGFSFEDIRDVRQDDRSANWREQEEKQQKQALVGLYLTVLYLALKNLVYVNSRYFLAFHCVERDCMLLNPEYELENGYAGFARDFLKMYPQKRRVTGYLETNFANADEWAIRTYRNKIEHLDAVRNADLYIGDVKEIHSWFELYHYILQRRIMSQFEYDSTHESRKYPGTLIITPEAMNPKTMEYFRKVEKYGSYCKDFVKALNVAFAYNLPRYKNLSIDELFDRNRPLKKKGTGKDIGPEKI